MNRKGIVIKETTLSQRNRAALLQKYKPASETTEQLSGLIVESPEYIGWGPFFHDLQEDLYLCVDGIPHDKIAFIWVPGSMGIGKAETTYRGQLVAGQVPDFLRELKLLAENYGNAIVQYGNSPHRGRLLAPKYIEHDRLTFRMDRRGIVYCTKVQIASPNIHLYTHNAGEFSNGRNSINPPSRDSESSNLIFAYYHRPR